MSKNPIFQTIEENIKNNDITLFMKGTADFPQCGFSSKVVSILEHHGCTFKDINVLESDDLRQGIKEYSDWPTIPQLYIKGEFIGGCDIVSELDETGELEQMLRNIR